jgi:hypothetical protein
VLRQQLFEDDLGLVRVSVCVGVSGPLTACGKEDGCMDVKLLGVSKELVGEYMPSVLLSLYGWVKCFSGVCVRISLFFQWCLSSVMCQ